MFDLVYEMTGIDLTTTTKEDLQKEMMDEALSVVTFTPKPEEVIIVWFHFYISSQFMFI